MKSLVAVLGSVADDRRWRENSSKYVMKPTHRTEGTSLIETVSPSTSSWMHHDVRNSVMGGYSIPWGRHTCLFCTLSLHPDSQFLFDTTSHFLQYHFCLCTWHLCSMALPEQKSPNPSSTMTHSESNGEMCDKLKRISWYHPSPFFGPWVFPF